MELEKHLRFLISSYALAEDPSAIKPFGKGHINDTFLVTFLSPKQTPYIFQKINKSVFPNPEIIVENNRLAFEHLLGKSDLLLHPVKTKIDQKNFVIDEKGEYWRLTPFIAHAVTLEQATSPKQAFIAAQAFGSLIDALSDTDPNEYQQSIANFHDIGFRYQQFKKSCTYNFEDRARTCQREIEFIHHRASIINEMAGLTEQLPVRITHNDTKINNILFNASKDKCLHIIDLDTLMPGLVIHDFGDMVRTFCCPVSEDHDDLNDVILRVYYFKALVEGFHSGCGKILTQIEKENFIIGSKVMTLMMGIRFLTDYLNGDTYYKISDKHHNLRRAKNQFKLLQSIEDQEYRLIQTLI